MVVPSPLNDSMGVVEFGRGRGGDAAAEKKGLDVKKFYLDLMTGGATAAVVRAATHNFAIGAIQFERAVIELGKRDKNIPVLPLKIEDGLVKMGLGQGSMIANIVRFVPMYALSFAFKDTYKNILLNELSGTNSTAKITAVNLTSGGAAGVTSFCLLYPFDYARTRLMNGTRNADNIAFKDLTDCVIKIAKSEGPISLYKGFSVYIKGVYFVHGTYFGVFDTAKLLFAPDGNKLGNFSAFFLSWVVGTIASALHFAYEKDRASKLKQLKLKDVMVRGSLSNAFRAGGASLVLFVYDRAQHRMH